MVWGSSYLITTEFLPGCDPLAVSVLRALPAAILLMLVVRRLPQGVWWSRVFILGFLNFTLFWWLLFIAAYRLPGGVAATVGALQPLIVVFLSRLLLSTPLRAAPIIGAIGGVIGVALLVLGDRLTLDPWGLAAGFGAAVSMAAGTVLSRRWQPPVSALTITAWQLGAGGLLLLPIALAFAESWPPLTLPSLGGLAYLSLLGAAVTYGLWFRGLGRLGPTAIAPLGFLSPLSAVVLGWMILGQSLQALQMAGFALVLLSVWYAQRKPKTA
jgi:probable blue pigment (indigoidine) exporter